MNMVEAIACHERAILVVRHAQSRLQEAQKSMDEAYTALAAVEEELAVAAGFSGFGPPEEKIFALPNGSLIKVGGRRYMGNEEKWRAVILPLQIYQI
jgi:hypothetical protein